MSPRLPTSSAQVRIQHEIATAQRRAGLQKLLCGGSSEEATRTLKKRGAPAGRCPSDRTERTEAGVGHHEPVAGRSG
eukprot:6963467-Alexandrium_andersonii.AAC.1